MLFLAFSTLYVSGQFLPNNRADGRIPIPVSGKLFITKTEQPLLFIGNLETKQSSLILDQENLKILEIYPDSVSVKHFGEKGRDGVIVAELKNKIPLFRLEETLDYFKIPASQRTYKVLVNKRFINPDFFLADVKKIIRLETYVATQADIQLSPFYHHGWELGETYLNIITKE